MNLGSTRFGEFLDRLASREPVPGGGAVAAAVGALAAALAQMCMRYSIRKKTDEPERVRIEAWIAKFASATGRMLDSADDDAQAYAELNRLQRLDEDDPQRVAGWSRAVKDAIDAPWTVVQSAADLVEDLHDFAPICNRWLLSDLAIAAILVDAAVRSAAWNVRVNLPLMREVDDQRQLESEMLELLSTIHLQARWIERLAGGEATAE